MSRSIRTSLLCAPLLLALSPAIAAAQTTVSPGTAAALSRGFTLQQLDPAPAGDHFFVAPDGRVGGSQQPYLQALANYGHAPLRYKGTGGEAKLVSAQLYLHASATFAVARRVMASVDVPFSLLQTGDSVNGLDNDLTGGSIGDLRLGLRFNLLGAEAGSPFSLALSGDAFVPSGKATQLTSDGKERFHPRLSASGQSGSWLYAYSVGYLTRRELDMGNAEVGPAVTFSLGVAYRALDGALQVGPEIYGSSVVSSQDAQGVQSDTPFFGRHSTPLEALLGARYGGGRHRVGAAVGPGLTRAPGTPIVRALLSYSYVPEEPPEDRDGDGIDDPHDACPDQRGKASSDAKHNGCPEKLAPVDRDGDGVADAQDACPDQPGLDSSDPARHGCPADRDSDDVPDVRDSCSDVAGQKSDDPAQNGCPPDGDRDGVADAQDACPDVRGVKSDDPTKNGCPPDRDGDGIADAQDACPDQPGPADHDPKRHGCPRVAELMGRDISLREQVQFDTAKATINPASDPLLQTIAGILKAHPEVELVSVEGHTDNVGNRANNRNLSRNRARAVVEWLSSKGGVERKRLTFEGFGETRPVASNDTEEGRQKNRRVELKIVKQRGEQAKPAPGPGR